MCDIDNVTDLCDESFSLSIKIENVNDNAPVLNAARYTASITAEIDPGTEIPVSPAITATDADDSAAGVTDQIRFRIKGNGG